MFPLSLIRDQLLFILIDILVRLQPTPFYNFNLLSSQSSLCCYKVHNILKTLAAVAAAAAAVLVLCKCMYNFLS